MLDMNDSFRESLLPVGVNTATEAEKGTLSDAYIGHYLYALRVFFDWLQATGKLPANPISSLKFKTAVYNSRKPLSREEIQRLFDEATTVKERVVLHLFLQLWSTT